MNKHAKVVFSNTSFLLDMLVGDICYIDFKFMNINSLRATATQLKNLNKGVWKVSVNGYVERIS